MVKNFQPQKVESYMKSDGVQSDRKPSDSFSRRLNNIMFILNKHLTEEHLAGMTGPITLEMNMTQGMLNNAYLMPKRKLDIE